MIQPFKIARELIREIAPTPTYNFIAAIKQFQSLKIFQCFICLGKSALKKNDGNIHLNKPDFSRLDVVITNDKNNLFKKWDAITVR